MIPPHLKRKAGRPPKSPEGPATRNLTFRTRDSLREKLIEASTATGRSISEEIEHRLDKSFDRETLSKHIDNLLAESLTRAEEVGDLRRQLAVAEARIAELEAQNAALRNRLDEQSPEGIARIEKIGRMWAQLADGDLDLNSLIERTVVRTLHEVEQREAA